MALPTWKCLVLNSMILMLVRESLSLSCGQTTFTGLSGTINSPGYPGSYSRNMYCKYKIKVPSGRRIELSWSYFDVYGNMPSCSGSDDGYVAVFTGCNYPYLVSKFCSTNSGMPHKIYSKDECMEVWLKSNSQTAKGFRATYTAPSLNTRVSTGNCEDEDEIKYKDRGVIVSQNWPVSYPSSRKECQWELQTTSSKVFKLNFMDIQTFTTSLYCSRHDDDYVKVKGKDSKYTSRQNKEYYCGQKRPFSLTTRYYKLDIDLRADSHDRSQRGLVVGFITYRPQGTVDASFSKAAIAAVVIGGIAIVLCIVFGCRWYKRRSANQRPAMASYVAQPKDTNNQAMEPDLAPPPYSAAVGQGYPGYPVQQQPGPYPPMMQVPPPGSYPSNAPYPAGAAYPAAGPPPSSASYQAAPPYAGNMPYPPQQPGVPPVGTSEKQPLNPPGGTPAVYSPGTQNASAPYPPSSAPYAPPSSAMPPPY